MNFYLFPALNIEERTDGIDGYTITIGWLVFSVRLYFERK